jgi:hypothetical protein
MRWPWQRRPPPPRIPPYKVPVSKRETAKAPSIVVEEEDTSAMTRTGVFKAWKRKAGLPEEPK